MKKSTIIILVVSVIVAAAIAVYFVWKNRPSMGSESENDEDETGETDSTGTNGGNHSGAGTVENGTGKTTTSETLTYLDPSTLRPAKPLKKEDNGTRLTLEEYILDQLENIDSFDAKYIEDKMKILAQSGVLINGADASPLITQTIKLKATLGIEQPDAYLELLQETYKKILQAYYYQIENYSANSSTQPQIVKGNNFGNR